MDDTSIEQQDASYQSKIAIEPVKHQDLWFPDGNIVIRAENTLFKVYRGILCNRSPVFAGMFSMPQPENEEKYEGLPFVELYDPARDMTFFLLALFDTSIFTSNSRLTFAHISAFARLGTKYNVQHLRAFAIRLLRQTYPLTLSQFDDIYCGIRLPFTMADYGTSFDAINLARELDIIDILPAAFAFASFSAISRIISGIQVDNRNSEMSASDKLICLAGKERLSLRRSGLDGYLVDEPPSQCGNRLACRTKRLMHLTTLLVADTTPLMLLYDKPACKMCNDMFKQVVKEVRQRMWNELPEIFSLPSWEELKKARNGEEGGDSETD